MIEPCISLLNSDSIFFSLFPFSRICRESLSACSSLLGPCAWTRASMAGGRPMAAVEQLYQGLDESPDYVDSPLLGWQGWAEDASSYFRIRTPMSAASGSQGGMSVAQALQHAASTRHPEAKGGAQPVKHRQAILAEVAGVQAGRAIATSRPVRLAPQKKVRPFGGITQPPYRLDEGMHATVADATCELRSLSPAPGQVDVRSDVVQAGLKFAHAGQQRWGGTRTSGGAIGEVPSTFLMHAHVPTSNLPTDLRRMSQSLIPSTVPIRGQVKQQEATTVRQGWRKSNGVQDCRVMRQQPVRMLFGVRKGRQTFGTAGEHTIQAVLAEHVVNHTELPALRRNLEHSRELLPTRHVPMRAGGNVFAPCAMTDADAKWIQKKCISNAGADLFLGSSAEKSILKSPTYMRLKTASLSPSAQARFRPSPPPNTAETDIGMLQNGEEFDVLPFRRPHTSLDMMRQDSPGGGEHEALHSTAPPRVAGRHDDDQKSSSTMSAVDVPREAIQEQHIAAKGRERFFSPGLDAPSNLDAVECTAASLEHEQACVQRAAAKMFRSEVSSDKDRYNHRPNSFFLGSGKEKATDVLVMEAMERSRTQTNSASPKSAFRFPPSTVQARRPLASHFQHGVSSLSSATHSPPMSAGHRDPSPSPKPMVEYSRARCLWGGAHREEGPIPAQNLMASLESPPSHIPGLDATVGFTPPPSSNALKLARNGRHSTSPTTLMTTGPMSSSCGSHALSGTKYGVGGRIVGMPPS